MAVPQFDSNTWYSLQNVGNNAYLACTGISICGADASDLATFEFFQVASAGNGTSHYIRPQSRNVDESGEPFCINLSPGQPSLALCNQDSAVWGTGYWNGANADEGFYFFNTQLDDTHRLFLSDNGTWSLPDYTGESNNDQDSMRWNMVSRAAINNGSYSTVPAAISTGTTVATITSNSSSQTTVSDSSAITTSSPLPTSASLSASSTLTSSESSAEAPSTSTVLETPTVTASTTSSSGRTSTASTPSPTFAGRAPRVGPTTYTLAFVVAGLALPQLILGSL